MDTLNDIISELKWGDLDPIEAHDRVLALLSVSISLDEINEAADNALELTKLPTNPTTTERERELGHRAFKNGAIWAKIKYEKSNEYFFYQP